MHRIGRGRRGPVFVERRRGAPGPRAVADDRLFHAMVGPIDTPAAIDPIDPPRRLPDRPPERPELPRRKVRVRLDPDSPPTEVQVDGRPPRLGNVIAIGHARETA